MYTVYTTCTVTWLVFYNVYLVVAWISSNNILQSYYQTFCYRLRTHQRVSVSQKKLTCCRVTDSFTLQKTPFQAWIVVEAHFPHLWSHCPNNALSYKSTLKSLSLSLLLLLHLPNTTSIACLLMNELKLKSPFT